MPGASNPFELLAGARADGKPRKKVAVKDVAKQAAAVQPRATPPPPPPPPRPASPPPPRAPEVPQWTAVAPGAGTRSNAKKGNTKGRPVAAAAAAAPGSAFATLLALSPGEADGDDGERRANGAPASDVTAGYTLGAPFWQPLPDTQKGGAWLVPLTGPSGVTITTPVAPGVPRVRKGLPDGAVLRLTAQEERDIIIEYKHARAMEKKHRVKNCADGKPAKAAVPPPPETAAPTTAVASPPPATAAPAAALPALPAYLASASQAPPTANGSAAVAASASSTWNADAALATLRFAPPPAADVLATPLPLPQFAFAVRPNPYASATSLLPLPPPPVQGLPHGSPSPARGPPPGFARGVPPGFAAENRSPPPGFGGPSPPPPSNKSYVPPHLRG